jgi:predicted phosphodiesterase
MLKGKVGIIIPDQHIPLICKKAESVVLQAIEHIKPDIFINLGDVGEWKEFSSHDKKKPLPLAVQLPIKQAAVDVVNKGIDRFDKALDKAGCNERYIVSGNHDIWIDQWAAQQAPFLEGWNFREKCKWDERGYEYRGYNEVLTLGKISFTHGMYCTQNHAKKHLDAFGTSICYGHTHDVQRYSNSRLNDGAIGAWSMGCLKDMSPEANKWLRGRLTRWSHAFGIVTWFCGGNFQLDVIDIVNGRSNVWGKVLVAK